MDFNDQYRDKVNNIPRQYPHRPSLLFLTPENTIAIFTTLTILLKMREQLGLEAMLEYMEFYILTIEEHNPRFKGAVARAIELMNVEKIYGAMCPKKILENDDDTD